MRIGEEKIMEVAYALFKQRGVRSTRLQDIARRCGGSLWDINLIYKSKKDLVLAVLTYTINRKSAYLFINSSLSPSAITELKSFFKFVEDTVSEIGPELLSELRRYHPLALNQVKELVDNKLIPALQRSIERGLTEGFFRSELDYKLYSSTYFQVLRTMLESPRDYNETKDSITLLNEIFLHGALNVKGIRIMTNAPQ
jgi:TetR/AcrR family transcriptional regulator, cholesterol catabolism regulator